MTGQCMRPPYSNRLHPVQARARPQSFSWSCAAASVPSDNREEQQHRQQRHRVCIIGAGAAGLSAAWGLAQSGRHHVEVQMFAAAAQHHVRTSLWLQRMACWAVQWGIVLPQEGRHTCHLNAEELFTSYCHSDGLNEPAGLGGRWSHWGGGRHRNNAARWQKLVQ